MVLDASIASAPAEVLTPPCLTKVMEKMQQLTKDKLYLYARQIRSVNPPAHCRKLSNSYLS